MPQFLVTPRSGIYLIKVVLIKRPYHRSINVGAEAIMPSPMAYDPVTARALPAVGAIGLALPWQRRTNRGARYNKIVIPSNHELGH